MGIDSKIFLEEPNKKTYSLKKNTQGMVYGEMIYTDKNGFRVPYKNYKYLNNESSIFFIGDSTTFGNGIKEEDTFIGKLRLKNKNISFYNSSVIGHQISDHRKRIKLISKFPNIKKVYYVFTLNDVFNIDQISKKENIKFENKSIFQYLKSIKLFYEINNYLRNKSYAYMYIKGVASDPSKRYFGFLKNYYKEKKVYKNEIDYFIDLKNITKKNNIELSIIILPYEFQTRVGNCNTKNLEPQSKIIDVLKKMSIKYFDLTKSFCKMQKPKKLFYKFDPMHLSNQGHNFVFLKIQDNL